MDAFEKLQSGDVKGALTDFQKAVETSPELATKLGQKLLDKVPQQIKDQFAKLGITPEALQKAGPALPKLYEAADAASKGDWKGAYSRHQGRRRRRSGAGHPGSQGSRQPTPRHARRRQVAAHQ